MALIDELIKDGWLKTPRVITAFQKIKRVDFLPEDPEGKLYASYGASMKDLAELNEALPIGYGQTISQPLVVAFMLEQLQPEPGDKILDIGSGSGWTSGLLAEIVSQQAGVQSSKFKVKSSGGRVVAIEIIPELKDFGEKNVAKYNFIEKGIVEFVCTDGSKGYEKEKPFDKILVSATSLKLYPAWKEQLKIGGRIVLPINSSIWLFIKKSQTEFEEKEYPGFAFVPLIER